VPALWEVDIGGSQFKTSLGKVSVRILSEKQNNNQKKKKRKEKVN
jgi:hypothetical protein